MGIFLNSVGHVLNFLENIHAIVYPFTFWYTEKFSFWFLFTDNHKWMTFFYFVAPDYRFLSFYFGFLHNKKNFVRSFLCEKQKQNIFGGHKVLVLSWIFKKTYKKNLKHQWTPSSQTNYKNFVRHQNRFLSSSILGGNNKFFFFLLQLAGCLRSL